MNIIKSGTIITWIILISSVGLTASADSELKLSDNERIWLNNHPVIRLATDIAWPPFEWIDDAGEYQGIAADYMRIIESRLGIQFVIEKNKTWPEVVEAVKHGELDVFSCVAQSPQRKEYVNFTRPYLSFPMVIVTTGEVNYIDGIKGLRGMHVSVVKGYATHEYLSATHPDIKLQTVKTSLDGLVAVSQGKADVFIDNIATATSIIQESGLTNLKISGEMPIRYKLSMAVRKDWPELMPVLQRALDSISDELSREIHNKWIGVRYEHGFEYGLFWKSLGVSVLIIGFMYFYNRKLSREITDRIIAEKKAVKARDEADKANLAKSEFLSVVSHELRTPLTSIKGALGLLSSGIYKGIPVEAQQMLKLADENSNRLITLINDILDFEKIQAGKLVLNKEVIEVVELINNAVQSNQGYADKYGVSFAVVYDQHDYCSVTVDANRIIQVMSNLISNAIKYSPKGGCIEILVRCELYKVRISIEDQGEGIPEEFNERIFLHFSQADSSDSRDKGGTGLGLSISKEIIERHGGEIGFTSLPGKGACFYFELKRNVI